MSQVQATAPKSTITFNDVGPSAEAQTNTKVPQELQNARPSTSVLSKIGRVMGYIARGIGALATLGLSELAIWGIRKLRQRARASDEAPQPRVQPRQVNLPPANPRADSVNTELYNKMLKLDLPQPYKDALNELLQELSTSFGNNVPKTLENLQMLKMPKGAVIKPFVVALRSKVSKSPEEVTPAILKSMAKEILQPFLTRKAVASALEPEAKKLGFEMSQDGLLAAADELFAKEGEVVFNDQSQADDFVAKHADVAKAPLQKAAYLDGLSKDTLPTVYQNQLTSVLTDLRSAYGQDCLPTEIHDLLYMKVSDGFTLIDNLKSAGQHKPISPQDFGALLRDQLTPNARQYALGQALNQGLEASHGVKLHPKALNDLVGSLIASDPSYADKLSTRNNMAEVKTLVTQDAGVQNFLAKVATTMKAVEDQYLPKVNEDIRPMLKNIIHSLSFADDKYADSLHIVDTISNHMAGWKSNISFGDENTKLFCDKMVQELNIWTDELADQDPSPFTDNIYKTFNHDANRNNWTLNGTEVNTRPAPELEAKLREIAPNAVDQQFLSKLTNQYAWSHFGHPLANGTFGMSSESAEQALKGSGLTTHTKLHEGFVRAPRKSEDPQGTDRYTFTITVAPDQKSAVVDIIMPREICTDNKNNIVVGKGQHTMRVTCALSGGDPAVKPRVTAVQVSQHVVPLTN